MAEPPRYRFGPLERRGLVAGWRGGQILSVAAGLVLAVVALRSRPTPGSIAVAVGAVLGGLFLATWPLGGRTGEEWLPTVVRWGVDGLGGSRRRRSPLPALGHRRRASGAALPPPVPSRARARSRSPFARLAVLAVTPGNGDGDLRYVAGAPSAGRVTIGVISDGRAGTYTAILAVRGHSFALLGPDEKDRRVAGWAGVLASLAREGSGVHRVQWLASTIPDDGRGVRSYLADRAAVPEDHPARRSYVALLGEAGASACRHEVHLAVQVRAGRRSRPAMGSAGGTAGACAALLREVRSLSRRLGEIDVVVDGVLDPAQVSSLLRRTTDAEPGLHAAVNVADGTPGSGAGAESGGHPGGHPGNDGPAEPTDSGWPWPLTAQSEWGHLRADSTFHATYWVAEWPRVDVGPDFLGPMLLGPVRRTTAVVMEPLSPSRATRQVEQARTADLADAELRRRGGFLATARRERETELVLRRERELADGHASFRFSGYVTVTAPSADRLAEACEATEQAAGQARLDLRRLYGEQEQAFTFTLPLCRGLS